MINIGVAILIIFLHWFADFVCQTREMGTKKSTSNYWLSYHVLAYSFVTLVFWHFCFLQPSHDYVMLDFAKFFLFIYSTHWITDYTTSRMSGYFYVKSDFYNFFNVIGFDQILHYIQLFFAYYYFVK